MIVNHTSPLPSLGEANVPDDQRLAMIVQGVDQHSNLHAWPIPLNVVRHWADPEDARATESDHDAGHDPSLPWLTVDRVETLLQHLNRVLPCSSDEGWYASTCHATEERDGQPDAVTVWLIHVPPSACPSSDHLGVQQTVRAVRQALMPVPGVDEDWMVPPTLFVPMSERPTGSLMMMDDTVEENTVRTGVEAMRSHVAHLLERRTLNDAVGTDPSVDDRPRSRL